MRKPISRPVERLDSEPLLNEEQRAALDAALEKKRAEQPEPPPSLPTSPLAPAPALDGPDAPDGGGKPPPGRAAFAEAPKTKRDLAHDHHLSRRGRGNGRVKKSGAGGKFTWGAALDPGDADAGGAAFDRGDPNYSSDEFDDTYVFTEARATQIAAYKAAVAALLAEFFDSGDVGEAAARLAELGHPEFGRYFVKRAITAALDRHDREREMTSALLSGLYGEAVPWDQMRRGFSDVVAALDDTALDVPGAVDLVARFVCRAVADDVLPPAWVDKVGGDEGSAAAALRLKCDAHLRDAHFAERMSRAWGAGAGSSLAATKAAIGAALAEFWAAGDAEEVRRVLRHLAVPSFGHELVKQAVAGGTEGAPRMDAALRLLRQLAASRDVSASQMTKGFRRVAEALGDLELDNPGARGLYAGAAVAAAEGGWLEEGWGGEASTPETPGSAPGSPPAGWANGREHGAGRPSVRAFKAAALGVAAEYFDSGDAGEAGRRLAEMGDPGLLNIFVKHLVQLSMDRRGRERELASALLPALTASGALPPDQAALGFTRLLAAADDLALDHPDAGHQLTLFLGRAVVDEVLPPRFLAGVVPSLPGGGLGVGVVRGAGSLLSARHAAERFATCWAGGGGRGAAALAAATEG